MRIGQLELLTPDELGLLLYIVNEVSPTSPKMEIPPKFLPIFKHDILLAKVARQEEKLTEEGKKVYSGLMDKLNKTWIQEIIEHENSNRPEFTQSELPFGQS